LRRPLTSRKGASEVIAVMLLIVITIAASILLYAYVSGLMGRLQGTAVRQPYLEQIALDYYDWTTLSTLKLTIRNVGPADIDFQSADYFVNGTSVAATVTITSSTATTPLLPQNSATITLTGLTSLRITRGVAYNVKIATRDGAIFSFSCIAGRTS
jgi:flagellin-like protein